MNRIEEMLENALSTATLAKEINAIKVGNHNVMISGLTGSGKTSIVKQWAKDKGIALAPYDLSQDATTIYKPDKNGILRPEKAEDPILVAKQLVFNALIKYNNGEDFILFLDDFHLATPENLEAIYYTMDNNKIFNPSTGEEVKLNNLLFTVAIKTDLL